MKANRWMACAAVWTLAVAIAPVALAQTQAEGQTGAQAQPQADDGAVNGDIIVTAQKRVQTLTEVPVSVSVLSPVTMERQAIVESRQLVQISPSLTFSEGSADRGASFNMRGISSTAQEGGIQPSLALVIDGVPIARQGEFLSNFMDIEQIEVLAGPQGTLFGKNATAGVINIRTRNPGRDLEVIGQADYTTDDEIVLRGTVNLPLSDAVRLRVNGLYDDQSPIIRNVGIGGDVGGSKTYAFSGKLAIDLTPDLDVLIAGDYRHRENTYGVAMILVPNSGALGDLQRVTMGVPIGRGVDVTNVDGNSLTESEGWSVAGTVNWRFADKWTATSITAYREYSFDNSTDIDAGPTGWLKGRGFAPNPNNYPISYIDRGFPRQPSDSHYFSQELRFAYSGDNFDVVAGGFYQRYREELAGSSPFIRNGFYIDGAALTADYRNDSKALFADATWEFIDSFKLFGGLRYTWESVGGTYVRTPYNNPVAAFDPVTGVNNAAPVARFAYDQDRSDKNLSGRAGIQYVPTRDQNYYVSFNRGFKGAALDLSSGWTPAARVFAAPEIATAFEVGTRQTILDNKLYFSLALYAQKVKDVQQATTVPDSTTLATQLQNAGDIKSRGVEMQFNWRATRGLTLAGGIAYTDAEYRGGLVTCNVSQRAGLQGGCTLDLNNDGIAETQSLTGHPAKETPKVSLNMSADYEYQLNSGGRLFAHTGASWIDKIQYQLLNDPLTLEPSHWLVDASIGFESADRRWRVMLFGKNLTNEFYYGNLGQTDGFIARSWARVSRDSKRYGGISVKVAM
jgi:iron complex outermembrane receptor protein